MKLVGLLLTNISLHCCERNHRGVQAHQLLVNSLCLQFTDYCQWCFKLIVEIWKWSLVTFRWYFIHVLLQPVTLACPWRYSVITLDKYTSAQSFFLPTWHERKLTRLYTGPEVKRKPWTLTGATFFMTSHGWREAKHNWPPDYCSTKWAAHSKAQDTLITWWVFVQEPWNSLPGLW